MRCGDCKYCKSCKELVNNKWEWFKVCVALADEKDGWCMVVKPWDKCEMFDKKNPQ